MTRSNAPEEGCPSRPPQKSRNFLPLQNSGGEKWKEDGLGSVEKDGHFFGIILGIVQDYSKVAYLYQRINTDKFDVRCLARKILISPGWSRNEKQISRIRMQGTSDQPNCAAEGTCCIMQRLRRLLACWALAQPKPVHHAYLRISHLQPNLLCSNRSSNRRAMSNCKQQARP